MALGLIFGGCIILIYQKMKLQSKNYEILNKQKLRKKIYIYLPLTCFLYRNSLTKIYSRTIISSSSGMSCKSSVSKIAAEFSLTGNCLTLSSFCRSQLGLTLKSSSKITLGLILRVGLTVLSGKHGRKGGHCAMILPFGVPVMHKYLRIVRKIESWSPLWNLGRKSGQKNGLNLSGDIFFVFIILKFPGSPFRKSCVRH